MSLINPIRYTIYDQVVPSNRMPTIEVATDGMAYGTIECRVPLTAITTLTAKCYRVFPPNSSETRWNRVDPELVALYPTCVYYTSSLLSTGYFKITWRFDPTALAPAGVFSGNYFDLEFVINSADSAAVTQLAPKLTFKIMDEIVNSGLSGYSGMSGMVYYGYSGYSGQSGYSGFSGLNGDVAFSGYSGASGISGYSGHIGISGYSGLSGFSGYSGLSGFSGYSGLSGFSGYSGLSGYSGTSGFSGYSGIGTSGYSGQIGISGYSGYSGTLFGADYTGHVGEYTGLFYVRGSTTIDATTFIVTGKTGPAGSGGWWPGTPDFTSGDKFIMDLYPHPINDTTQFAAIFNIDNRLGQFFDSTYYDSTYLIRYASDGQIPNPADYTTTNILTSMLCKKSPNLGLILQSSSISSAFQPYMESKVDIENLMILDTYLKRNP